MEKQKTAMQQALRKINEGLKLIDEKYPDYDDMPLGARGLYDGYTNAKTICTNLLAEEKRMIYNAYLTGISNVPPEGEMTLIPTHEEYYSETFERSK